MSQPVFDAASSWRVDLESGSIRSRDDEEMVLVPVEMLFALEPTPRLEQLSREWGEAHGRRLAAALRGSPDEPGMAVLAQHLAGSLAVAGLGKASVEVRGDALLFRIDAPSAVGGAGFIAVVSGFLGGYLSTLSGLGRFEVLHLESERGAELFWGGNPGAAERMRRWLRDGTVPVEALDLLAQEGAM